MPKLRPQSKHDAAVVGPTLPGHARSLLASTLVEHLRRNGLKVAAVSTAGRQGGAFRLGSPAAEAAVANATAVVSYDSRFVPPKPNRFHSYIQAQVLALNECPDVDELPFSPNWIASEHGDHCEAAQELGARVLPAPFYAGFPCGRSSVDGSAVAVVVSRDTVESGALPLVESLVQELRGMTGRKLCVLLVGSVPPNLFSKARLARFDAFLLRARTFEEYHAIVGYTKMAVVLETPRTWGVLTQLAAAAGVCTVAWDVPLSSRWLVDGVSGSLVPCELYRTSAGVYLPVPDLSAMIGVVARSVDMLEGYAGWRRSQALLAEAAAQYGKTWNKFFGLREG